MATGYVWHELYSWHNTDQGAAGLGRSSLTAQPLRAVESPESKSRINSMIHVSGLIDALVPIAPDLASQEDLLRIHTTQYVASIRTQSDEIGGDAGDGRTVFGAGSYEIARLAAGGTIAATRAVLDGEVENAYALVRPAGHHALPGTGMGTCIFANIPIAIRWAQANRGLGRAAVIDWDVHHGNGTQTIFEQDPSVLAISIHQDGLYPRDSGSLVETGVGAGVGTTINIPLPAGTGDGGYVEAFAASVVPAIRAFRPELIYVASGFDASALDPLGNQVVTSTGYRTMTKLLMEVAREVCSGRIVMSHEGGYSPIYTPYCGLAVVEQLAEVSTAVEDTLGTLYRQSPASRVTDAQREVIVAAAELATGITPG